MVCIGQYEHKRLMLGPNNLDNVTWRVNVGEPVKLDLSDRNNITDSRVIVWMRRSSIMRWINVGSLDLPTNVSNVFHGRNITLSDGKISSINGNVLTINCKVYADTSPYVVPRSWGLLPPPHPAAQQHQPVRIILFAISIINE